MDKPEFFQMGKGMGAGESGSDLHTTVASGDLFGMKGRIGATGDGDVALRVNVDNGTLRLPDLCHALVMQGIALETFAVGGLVAEAAVTVPAMKSEVRHVCKRSFRDIVSDNCRSAGYSIISAPILF
jgi:hypothetical protein